MVFFKKRFKRGQLAISVILLIVLTTILLAGSIMSAVGVKATVISYNVAEAVLNSSQSSIDSIQDGTVRTAVQDTVNSAKTNTVDSISIYTSMYKFSPYVGVLIVVLVAFLLSRRSVETGQIV